jgi:hypothetical protein
LFFSQTQNTQTDSTTYSSTSKNNYIRNLLTFNTDETLEYITYVAYFFILTDILLAVFKLSFVKWLQLILLVFIVIFIIVIILFKILFNFTNPEKYDPNNPPKFSYFNTNYIFLFILFLLSYLILFKLDPSHFLKSSMNYAYIIGFVFGLVILFSLSLLFNNEGAVAEVLDGEYSSFIKYGLITVLSFAFLYFLFFYIKKGISAFKTTFDNETNPILFVTSSILNIGILVVLLGGIYLLIRKFQDETPFINVILLAVLIVGCFTIYNSTVNMFYSHSNTKTCSINLQLWRWREITCVIFLILGIYALSTVKTDQSGKVSYADMMTVIGFTIMGYYIGGYLYNMKEKNKSFEDNVQPTINNCDEFLNNKPSLSFLETTKALVMISIMVALFFSMNIFVKNLSDVTLSNSNFIYFLGLFFILLFFIYVRLTNSSFTYIVELIDNMVNKNYFSSPNTHKLNDFMFIVFVIFVFFSSMGLIEIVATSNIIQAPIDYIAKATGLTDPKNAYLFIFKKLYDMIILIFNVIMFIPCIFNDVYQYFYESSKMSNSFVFILIIEFCLILFYILYRKFINFAVKRHTDILLKNPVMLYPPTILSNNAQNNSSVIGVQANIPQKVTYHFGLSCWIYIESGMNNNTFLNILNYNDSPAILYKPSMNSIIVTGQLNPENVDIPYKIKGVDTKNTLVNETIKSFTTLNNNRFEGIENRKIVCTTDVKIQKWNNIFVNYSNGVIDVFMNGKLITSNSGNMIDSDNYKNFITLGNDIEDIPIKICNVCFYDKNLNIDEISQVYDGYKNLNPPVKH